MVAAERGSRAAATIRRLSRSVGAKLFTLVFLVLLLSFGLLGYANVRLHRQQLEVADHANAARINEIIRRSTSYYMMRNDRAALRHTVETIGQQSAIVGLRIYSADGRVAFSTEEADVGARVEKLPSGGTRIFENGEYRVMGIATPIMNTPSCSSAACHAHPAGQQLLGLLETKVSLAAADASVSAGTIQFVVYSAIAILLTLGATALFVWKFVHSPVRELRRGTERLAHGELGVQIPVRSRDEMGTLAVAFNDMSRELCDARNEITAWTHTLEERVQRKTSELQRAQEQMIQAEKLTSLGKLAAVVAHEINNPLSGILTYAKLMRKWVERGDDLSSRSAEMRDSLALIESESRRCGEIVRSLLMFARAAPMNVTDVDVNKVVRQCVKLVEHKLELGNIVCEMKLQDDLPPVRADGGQIEQLLLALVMNAIDAMPREGVLRLTTATEGAKVVMTVEDNGTGIDPALLPRLFEPFATTKEEGKGVGLGLAISQGIVERHHGKIAVDSEPGRGTKFTITLPAEVLVEA
ncbi:MAG TPA: ATP-binding protein [Thermoanaerobaculia bacterium]|nr:ATP-binding protein [Thermoanaerobaculia bacterium]